MSDPVLRDATPDDVPRILEMGHAFLQATAYLGRVTPDEGHMRRLAEVTMQNGRMVLGEVDGRVVGMFGMMVFDDLVRNVRVGEDVIIWVEMSARGTGLGAALFHEFTQWAKASGATKLRVSVYRDPVFERLLRRRGYEQADVVYEKDLSDDMA